MFLLQPVIQPELAQIIYAGSNFPHLIRFHFSKEGLDNIVQNRPGSDLDGLVRFGPNAWSKPVCKNHWARFLSESNPPATSFSLLDSVVFFHRPSRSHCAKPGQIQFHSGWLCQVLVKWILSRSKPVCKNHPACLWADPDQTRIGFGTFTGITVDWALKLKFLLSPSVHKMFLFVCVMKWAYP